MSGAMIGALVGFLIGAADYTILYRVVAAARARQGADVGPLLRGGLFVISVVAFTIVGYWVGAQLEAQGIL